jgi:TRAP-type C4-dicarboxylate transport system substrate-binding protein
MITSAFSAPVALKQGTVYPESSNYGKAIDRFAELSNKYSNGEVKITVYHGGQLGKHTQMVENIMRGTTDIHIETVDIFERFVPEVFFQGMSYLFRDTDHVRKFYRSDWFDKNVHAKFKEKGVMFIEQKYTWVRGPFRVLVTRIPILTPDDVKKIKLRVFASETYKKIWQGLGANTTNVDWTEVYLALKQNMIQGVTSPIDLVKPMKFTEVAKYITNIDEFPQVLLVWVNQKNFEKLTPAQRQAIQKAGDEAGEFFSRMNAEGAEADIDFMIETDGVTYIKPPLKEWREKVRAVYEGMEKDGSMPKGFYQTVQSLK